MSERIVIHTYGVLRDLMGSDACVGDEEYAWEWCWARGLIAQDGNQWVLTTTDEQWDECVRAVIDDGPHISLGGGRSPYADDLRAALREYAEHARQDRVEPARLLAVYEAATFIVERSVAADRRGVAGDLRVDADAWRTVTEPDNDDDLNSYWWVADPLEHLNIAIQARLYGNGPIAAYGVKWEDHRNGYLLDPHDYATIEDWDDATDAAADECLNDWNKGDQ